MSGDGTKMASMLAPEHAALVDNLKEQLLIVFLKRMGGTASIPISEVDDTGQDLFTFSVRDGVFHFELRKKS